VLTIVVCGARVAAGIATLVKMAVERGSSVQVITIPAALAFFDPADIQALTGSPVRSEYSTPALHGHESPTPSR
jgi:phosphopantothenoylcysteine synthetase/decarboxylase